MRIGILSYYFGHISGEEQQRHALKNALMKLDHVNSVDIISAERKEKKYRPIDFPGKNNLQLSETNLDSYDLLILFSYWEKLKTRTFVINYIVNLPLTLRDINYLRSHDTIINELPNANMHLSNSKTLVDKLNELGLNAKYSTIFYDENNFYKIDNIAKTDEVVYVGSNLPFKGNRLERYIDILCNYNLSIYGWGWSEKKYMKFYKGILEYADLRLVYNRAKIVFGYTADFQRDYGMVNNRVFEVLACNGTLVTDDIPWITNNLNENCSIYTDTNELINLVENETFSTKCLTNSELIKYNSLTKGIEILKYYDSFH
ncbi:MAG: glycosyltransferase [Fermentimonas sp.]|nr:glycosyltransferase [Dysgonamonadaceae bacterium]MDD4697747.1 glycosyltransferase [Fermentimonas sp.]